VTSYLGLAALVVIGLLVLFVAHAIACRAARYTRYAAAPPQTIALDTIAASNIPMVYAAWSVFLKTLPWLDLWCGIMYVLATYNACCFGYFCLLNVTETSLHVNILMRLWAEGGTRPEDLARRYSVKHMIEVRIERMIGLGQLAEREGRYFLRNRTFLMIERVYDTWRRILGLPLNPS
jgi:hypothetical protein